MKILILIIVIGLPVLVDTLVIADCIDQTIEYYRQVKKEKECNDEQQ